MRRFAILVVASVLLAVGGLVAVSQATPDRSGAAAGLPTPATPVLSLRRIAPALVDLVASTRLTNALNAALATPALGASKPCLLARSGARTIFTTRAADQVLPASTMKLLTATAALAALGPDFRFTTTVRAAAAPAAGVVAGDLWLIGGGDPLLQTGAYYTTLGDEKDVYTHLETLADGVVAAGVKVVQGAVVGDESRYDALRAVATWKPQYLTDGEAGSLSALLVNDAKNPKPVPLPAVFAAATFTDLLKARGVQVVGPAAARTAPVAGATLASLASPPLTDIVAEMLRVSDNDTAEMLVKELAHMASKGPGSTAAGVAVVRAVLAKAGLDTTGLVNRDGSGLDRGDRVTCSLLAATVALAGRHSALADGLPVAATSGTLLRRLGGTPAAGRVRAKTGTLEDVSALAGWVDPKAGTVVQPVCFAFVADNLPNQVVGPSVGDRISLALATWPDAPPVAQLAPLPVRPAG
jgi:D-alanyl-D-alanine carboxypeptidase/D-alanyl-D-alanine-endopeptidase (penicillin-binding protein 4)